MSGSKWPGPAPADIDGARGRVPAGSVLKDSCTDQQLADALTVCAAATRRRLEEDRRLIDLARRRGMSWARIAQAIGHHEPKAYRRWLDAQLGGQLVSV